MVKEPRPGRVKTRLAKDIGSTRAAWWFRHSASRLMRELRDPRWQTIVGVTPDIEGTKSRVWPCDLLRLPQGNGDLGDRMACLLNAAPPGPVLIVGADIPSINRFHINRAFRALAANDLVFGPARDGGFWLVGAKRLTPLPKGLFKGVRWSCETTLSDTLAGISDRRIAMVDVLGDVDTAADL